jgi:hypothetical protein
MIAKQVLGLSVWVLAGAVSAQTVPAEQWVGAPIITTSTASRQAVMADYAAARSMPQVASELRVGPADAPTGAISSAEVRADLNLWIRSGLGQVANRDSFDPSSAAYRAQFASYMRMRNGPEFVAEVQRIKGTSMVGTTSAQSGAAPATN